MKRTKRFMAMLLMFLLCAGEIGSTGINVFAAGDPVKGTGTIPDVVQEAETVSGDTALDATIETDTTSSDAAEDEAKEAETAAGGSRYRLVLLEGCKAYEDVNRRREIPSGSMIDIPSMIYFYAPPLPRQEFDQWFFATGKGDDPAIDDSIRFHMKNTGRVSSMKRTFISAVFDSDMMDYFKDKDTIYADSMYTDATGPFVDKVSVNVTTPKSGKAPDYDVTTDSEECKIYTLHWIDAESGKNLKESDTFSAGKVYEADVWLDEKDGYTIDTLTNVYINGHKATYKDRIRGSSIFSYNFRVDVVNVTVTEPVIGANPDFTASTDSTICTIGLNEVAWIDADSGHILDTTDKFEDGHTYRAVVWLDPTDGNSITSETEVYINGKEAIKSNASGSAVQYKCNFKLVEPGYDLWVGGIRVTDSNKNDILGDGKASYNPSTNTLTFNNATITTTYTHEKSGKTMAIRSENMPLTIKGTVNINVPGADFAIDSYTAGTNDNVLTLDGNITINGSKKGILAEVMDVKFAGGRVDIKNTTESAVTASFDGKILFGEGMDILEPVGGAVLKGSGDNNHVTSLYKSNSNAENNLVKTTTIGQATGYNLWVNGTEVTEANKSLIPCDSGTATFDPSTYTLTFNDATITDGYEYSTGFKAGIYSRNNALTIKGKVNIESADLRYGIY